MNTMLRYDFFVERYASHAFLLNKMKTDSCVEFQLGENALCAKKDRR